MRDRNGVSRRKALRLARTREYAIYALVDPRDMLPRYVGRSVNPKRRFLAHRRESRFVNPTKAAWHVELRAVGREPLLLILAVVRGALNAAECEQFWVDYGRARGWPLVNGSGDRFTGNLGLGRSADEWGRYWTLEALGLRPKRWPVPSA